VEHLLLEFSHGDITGCGETGGFDTGNHYFDTATLKRELLQWLPSFPEGEPPPRQQWSSLLRSLSSPARCAVDLALHDWWAKKLGFPLWQLWGLQLDSIKPTSITIGLGDIDQMLQRLQQWRELLPATRVKLKLGSPLGHKQDQALVEALLPHLAGAELQVDANGGWNPDQAQIMVPWLADRGVVLVEQPLPACCNDQDQFASLQGLAPIALVADESCWGITDLLRLAPHVQGVNLKLLKTGGLTDAFLMAQLAQSFDLKLMLGCYSDSSLLNSAASQLLPLVEWPDLDSHLNLSDDPFPAPPREGDLIKPSQLAGLGLP
jgi:L-alanine-DL-glutamate epimerase-like enolase superfamily enzyme